jgi:predicted MFS family arabinose efflux permease
VQNRVTRRAAVAVAVVFFANGALFANWVARIPAVKDALDAGDGALGLALLGIAAGSLVTMPFAGGWCERVGSRTVVVVSLLAVAGAITLVAHAPSIVALGGLLMLYGGAFGVLDVAMNVQAVALVRRTGRPIMPWFHAAFSVGGLVGAGTGALAAEAGLSPLSHFALTAATSAAVVLTVRRHLLPDRAPTAPSPMDTRSEASPPSLSDPAPDSDRATRQRRLVLVGLGLVAGCAALGEGAMADWTALFLRDVAGAGAGVAALGFAAFSITMTAGRLGGEAAILRLGPVRVLQLGGAAVATGVVLAVAGGSPIPGLIGFGLVGLGFSCAFPLALTTAGESSDGAGGQEIATVSVVGYLGFLIGPPFIGLLAEVVELRLALLAVLLPAVGLVTLSHVVGIAPTPDRHDDRCS